MRKYVIAGLAGVMVLSVAWVAVGQPQGGGAGQGAGGGRGMGGRGGFMNREAQMKAIATLQEQVGKLKALLETMPAMPAGGFQDMTDEDRTKMQEARQKIRDEQPAILTAIEQQLAQIKGIRTLMTENEESTAELKALQEAANGEKATKTAAKIGEMIVAKQKKFEENVKALGFDPANLPQGGRGMGGGMGGGQRQGPGQ